MRLLITNYLDVISSWCFWATPAWQELQKRYADRVDFQWKIALMDKTGLPPTHAHMEWFYRRSGTLMRSPVMLQTSWHEVGREEYPEPNCVAEAARDLGVSDDRVWMALSRAELLEGKKIGQWDVAAEIGAAASGLEKKKLLERAQSPEIEARVRATHRRVSRSAGDAAPHLRDRHSDWRSRGLFRVCQIRSHRRRPRRHAGRHRGLRSARRALRRAASLIAQKRLAPVPMWDTTSPRFGPCREPAGAPLASVLA